MLKYHFITYSVEFFPELRAVWKVPQTWWNIPEANIRIFRLQEEKFKTPHCNAFTVFY